MATGPTKFRPIHILLVEDNPGDIELTQEALKEGKIVNRMDVVRDGEQALDYLYRKGRFFDAARPDMILLDLHMPRKTGKEVLTVIRADATLADIPVVVFSSNMAEKELIKDAKLHVDGYIVKPLTIDQLLAAVAGLKHYGINIVKAASAA